MRRKEENVLLNNELCTFCLWLNGLAHMVNDHSENETKHAAATSCATLISSKG